VGRHAARHPGRDPGAESLPIGTARTPSAGRALAGTGTRQAKALPSGDGPPGGIVEGAVSRAHPARPRRFPRVVARRHRLRVVEARGRDVHLVRELAALEGEGGAAARAEGPPGPGAGGEARRRAKREAELRSGHRKPRHHRCVRRPPAHRAAADGGVEGRPAGLVPDVAAQASAVEHAGPPWVGDHAELARADQVPRRARQRRVDDEHVGGGEQLVHAVGGVAVQSADPPAAGLRLIAWMRMPRRRVARAAWACSATGESMQACGVWSGSGRIPAHGGGGGRCRSWCGG
jgi:hypothetical protein